MLDMLVDEIQALLHGSRKMDLALRVDEHGMRDAHLLRRCAPVIAVEEDRFGCDIGQGAGMRAGWHEDAYRLHALCWLACARIEDMAIALPVALEVALVIARSADGPAIRQIDRSNRTRLARMLDADTPWTIAVLADCDDVAARRKLPMV